MSAYWFSFRLCEKTGCGLDSPFPPCSATILKATQILQKRGYRQPPSFKYSLFMERIQSTSLKGSTEQLQRQLFQEPQKSSACSSTSQQFCLWPELPLRYRFSSSPFPAALGGKATSQHIQNMHNYMWKHYL